MDDRFNESGRGGEVFRSVGVSPIPYVSDEPYLIPTPAIHASPYFFFPLFLVFVDDRCHRQQSHVKKEYSCDRRNFLLICCILGEKQLALV